MKSRTVQPAASFQPPETCTEHVECQAGQASNADLCRAAQAHYDKISTAAHEWHSAIPRAIDAYYKDVERSRLEHKVIEVAKRVVGPHEDKWSMLVAFRDQCRAVDALNDFEAKQETK